MATPVFCCGGECGIVASVVGAHWYSPVGVSSGFDTTIKRSGARSLHTVNGERLATDFVFSSNITVTRLYVYFDTLPLGDIAVCFYGAEGVTFKVADSTIYTHSSTTFGSIGYAITSKRWYRIDLIINASGNPRLVDAKIDGNSISQASRAVASAAMTEFSINGTDAYFDDIIFSFTLGDYPIGNGKVDTYVCTADGTHNIAGGGDFQRGNTAVDILNATTTAFQLIDDVPLPSGAVNEADNWRGVAPANPTTDYVEGLFGPASGVPVPKTPPRAVEVILAHHQIATTVGQMTVRLNDNGTVNDIFNTGAAAGVTTYRYARKHYAAGPAGAWVIGGGGNGDFTDLRCRFLAQDANPDQCLDAIMIEAEFAEPQQKVVQVKQAVNRASTY